MKVRVLAAIILMFPLMAAETLELDLFPNEPFTRITIPDRAVPYSEITLPEADFGWFVSSPLHDLLSVLSVGINVPLLRIGIQGYVPGFVPDDVVGSAVIREGAAGLQRRNLLDIYMIAGTSLRSDADNISYAARAELLLGSPKIDSTLNWGESRLFLSGGMCVEGTFSGDAPEESISSLRSVFGDGACTFFGDAYIIANSPWSLQYLILKLGVDGIGEGSRESANISLVLELPSILPRSWFVLSPVGSIYIEVPFWEQYALLSGELGLLFRGRETGRSVFAYGRFDLDQNNADEPWKWSVGMRVDV